MLRRRRSNAVRQNDSDPHLVMLLGEGELPGELPKKWSLSKISGSAGAPPGNPFGTGSQDES